jgi:DNA-directed RNA polymerase subunit RPC12/RpoP
MFIMDQNENIDQDEYSDREQYMDQDECTDQECRLCQTHHTDPNESSPAASLPSRSSDIGPEFYVCLKCHTTFRAMRGLEEHQAQLKHFMCNYCGKCFEAYSYLDEHRIRVRIKSTLPPFFPLWLLIFQPSLIQKFSTLEPQRISEPCLPRL